jgi:hypothetical protein
MKKLALLFVNLLAVTLAAATVPSFAAPPFNDYYVDAENGTDGPSNTNVTCGVVLANNANTPPTGPCATLNHALAVSSPGSNILVVHGGAFGPIYLTGAISIIGPPDKSLQIINSGAGPGCIGAAPGTCAASTTAAIEIAAGSTDSIKLRNVTVAAGSAGVNAIQFDSGFGLALTETALRGGSTTSTGAMLNVTPSSGSQVQIYIHNSDIAFSPTMGAVAVAPTGTTSVRMNFSGGEVHNAVFGLQAISTGLSGTANIQVLIDNTEFFSFNNSAISLASSNSSNGAAVSLTRSSVTNTGGAALKANGAGAGGILYESAIIGNGTGVNVVNGAGVFTYQNNEILFNGNNCEVNSVPTACTSALTAQAPF